MVHGNCASLTTAELEVTVFGQGKHQQAKAIAMCADCPIKAQCLEIGKQTPNAWGVFGSYAFRDGIVVRGPNV